MIIKRLLFLLIIFNSVFYFYSDQAKNWDKEKEKAEKLYNSGKFDEAIILFREINMSSNSEKLIAETYFWLAMAYIEINKLSQAETNLEYYLANYKSTGLNYQEAVYQKGRLLFLQEEYQSSIYQFNHFIETYPSHKLVSNAYYWIGECLYALGQFDDSAYYFHIVLEKYPNAIKTEASNYKLRLIEHKKSELALQNLLKWSQEQYLSALSEFRVKEKTMKEALEKYKKGENLEDKEEVTAVIDSDELKRLQDDNQILKQKIEELEKIIEYLKGEVSDQSIMDKLKQLELKERLLENKEATLNILEKELREREQELGKK